MFTHGSVHHLNIQHHMPLHQINPFVCNFPNSNTIWVIGMTWWRAWCNLNSMLYAFLHLWRHLNLKFRQKNPNPQLNDIPLLIDCYHDSAAIAWCSHYYTALLYEQRKDHIFSSYPIAFPLSSHSLSQYILNHIFSSSPMKYLTPGPPSLYGYKSTIWSTNCHLMWRQILHRI